jgi:hypothetical protein
MEVSAETDRRDGRCDGNHDNGKCAEGVGEHALDRGLGRGGRATQSRDLHESSATHRAASSNHQTSTLARLTAPSISGMAMVGSATLRSVNHKMPSLDRDAARALSACITSTETSRRIATCRESRAKKSIGFGAMMIDVKPWKIRQITTKTNQTARQSTAGSG